MLDKPAHLSSLSKSPGGFAYQRHKPEETDLYKIIEQNLPSFQSHLSNADISLPAFVHDEFRKYLRCGMLKHGFLRVKCGGCRFEHLVAFSCKLRGFCPSCGARRMVETSAHLIDHVIPTVPVRQWFLSFPWPLRLLFARQPDTLSRCLAVIIRAIETDLIHRAGLTRASGARSGVVTLVQRFGSALNLNPDAADELIAPLSWAQRLKRVFNMMGPPSDFRVPVVWRHHACYRTGPPSDH